MKKAVISNVAAAKDISRILRFTLTSKQSMMADSPKAHRKLAQV